MENLCWTLRFVFLQEEYISQKNNFLTQCATQRTRRPGNWQLRVREINPLVEIIGFTNGVSRTGPKGRSITLPMTS